MVDFWSQCSKDYAAKNGRDTETEKPAKMKKTAAVSEGFVRFCPSEKRL